MSRYDRALFSLAAVAAVRLLGTTACAGSADAAPTAIAGPAPITPSYVDIGNGVVCYAEGAALSCVKVR